MSASDDLLAIFPLANVVLFPSIQTPLHLFEPRYRQMARDALAGNRRIGMVTVEPEHCASLAGDPPVCAVGCEGVISQAEKLADGRYNIVLLGTRRFRIVDEPKRPGERLYRMATVERLVDPFEVKDHAPVAALRQRVIGLLERLVRYGGSGGPGGGAGARDFSPELFREVDDATLVYALSNAFDFQPEDKQSLLAAETILARFERLEGLLAFRAAELETLGGQRSGRLH